MTLDLAQAMKDGMRRLASGVCVISTIGEDLSPLAMTASSVTSVSDTPPSLLVCVNQSARIHDVLSKGHRFAVNVLGQAHVDVSTACSTGDQADARFKTGAWNIKAGAVPTLTGALAIFECVVTEVHPYGTHSVVIGDIQAVAVKAQGAQTLAPLIYFDGAYAKLEE